ncbi:unnamed protein product [Mytilus edulis]|uniref:Reverse transcriptase zinc-binding domain-containing protein n=1 Tax=Mytilus edulis TaxID=6550 RepID=A0A8S3UCD5_MYTED|nr:unnamed protein product [Mytilus edulis]
MEIVSKNGSSKILDNFFLEEIESKTTLVHLDRSLLKIGSVHPVWTSLSSTISDVKKGAVKIRLFKSSLCRLCGTSNEDITHVLLLCPALHQQRKALFSNLKAVVISMIGTSEWTERFKNQVEIVKLIIDKSTYVYVAWYLQSYRFRQNTENVYRYVL